MNIRTITFDAKQLCRSQHSGVLSTLSTSVKGYPFASVVPFYLTAKGTAIIYISSIALHTRNIETDSRVSLIAYDPANEDSQANGRVTIVGDAKLLGDDALVSEQYFTLFPQALAYRATHDFAFYEIIPERVRYIGGFGKIHWLDKAHWCEHFEQIPESASAMVKHMNEDHLDAMQAILLANFSINADVAVMLSVFSEGCHITTESGKIYFVPFNTSCKTPTEVRKALVELTQTSRKKIEKSINNN